ncbi:unnamed protein product [Trypanosoma congolense IL3000]|uniref:WGS project CAEQ00000000 data, annotated contig 2216 n=1 Tax=Trypanosoma congolense (strain IL3000) TaxID=1068625 RepID=F9WCD6_TRYCI|nr:unnamed protein product [Trypanosoma congolense IL3000]
MLSPVVSAAVAFSSVPGFVLSPGTVPPSFPVLRAFSRVSFMCVPYSTFPFIHWIVEKCSASKRLTPHMVCTCVSSWSTYKPYVACPSRSSLIVHDWGSALQSVKCLVLSTVLHPSNVAWGALSATVLCFFALVEYSAVCKKIIYVYALTRPHPVAYRTNRDPSTLRSLTPNVVL